MNCSLGSWYSNNILSVFITGQEYFFTSYNWLRLCLPTTLYICLIPCVHALQFCKYDLFSSCVLCYHKTFHIIVRAHWDIENSKGHDIILRCECVLYVKLCNVANKICVSKGENKETDVGKRKPQILHLRNDLKGNGLKSTLLISTQNANVLKECNSRKHAIF